MHHDLFSFTKSGEHFLFGLDCWYVFLIPHKKNEKKKIENTLKNIFVGRKCY